VLENKPKKTDKLLVVRISKKTEEALCDVIQARYKNGIRTKRAGVECAINLASRIYTGDTLDRVEQMLITR
jgi:hypothetical protein